MRLPSPDTSQRFDFLNTREVPDLPSGFNWDTQKKLYCPESLLGNFKNIPSRTDGRNISYVFCHRGFYEKAYIIPENTSGAIENGIRHGLFLHSLDTNIRNKFSSARNARVDTPRPTSNLFGRCGDYSIQQIQNGCLVSRRVMIDDKKLDDIDFHPATNEKVSGFLAAIWRQLQRPTRITLQLDFKDEDFATAIAYFSLHLAKPSMHTALSPPEPLIRSLLKGTMLKGYNECFGSFTHLCEEVGKKSTELYGYNYFQAEHLRVLPPIIMGFYPDHLKALARQQQGHDPSTFHASSSEEPCMSYDHLFRTFWAQVRSFVRIGKPGDPPYSFILEIAHSGLGLGYDKQTNTAFNPLNGEPIRDRLLFYESCVDRVMIDVSLRLRKEFPELLFSSCTRLPDLIMPDGKCFEAEFLYYQMNEVPQGERGLTAKLRAMHGGLYPQSHLVVADDPTAEIAARTWIDQKSNLDRSDLLHMPYDQWLSKASPNVVAAMRAINKPFLPNMISLVDTIPIPTTPVGIGQGRYSALPMAHHTVFSTLMPDNRWRRNLQAPEKGGSEIRLQIGDREFRFTNETRAYASRFATADSARQAVREGDEKKLIELLDKIGNIDSLDWFELTLLSTACKEGQAAIVELLLDKGASIVVKDLTKAPLTNAAKYGHLRVVKLLWERFPSLEVLGEQAGMYAFRAACEQGHEKVARFLLDENAATVEWDFAIGGLTPLQAASRAGHLDIINLILEGKPSMRTVNAASTTTTTNASGYSYSHDSALWLACGQGHEHNVERLLRAQAVKTATDEVGPLKPEVISKLQAAGLDITKLPIRPQPTIPPRWGGRKRSWAPYEGEHFMGPKRLKSNTPQSLPQFPALQVLATGCECLLCHINETFRLENWMPQESIQDFQSRVALTESDEATRMLQQMGMVDIEPAPTSQEQTDASWLDPVRIRWTRPAVLPDAVFDELASGHKRFDHVYNPVLAQQRARNAELHWQQYVARSRENGMWPPDMGAAGS